MDSPGPIAPPITPGAIGPKRTGPAAVGIVGLVLVLLATISSPAAICGLPALLIVPLGIAGAICCAIGLGSRPRWPGVAGLIIAGTCVVTWSAIAVIGAATAITNASSIGATVPQHGQMSVAAMEIFAAAEAQRGPGGSPPARFDWSNISPAARVDAWSIPYRYDPRPGTPRGYTFISDGPDRLPDTDDDIDLEEISTGGMFPLPPATKGGP